MGVYVPAGIDISGCKTDNLAVFDDGLAGQDQAHGYLVAGCNVFTEESLFFRKTLTAGQWLQSHYNVVFRMQSNAGSVVSVLQELFLSEQ